MTRNRKSLIIGLVIGAVISAIFGGGLIAGIVIGRDQAGASADLSNPDVRDFLSAYHLVTQDSYYRPLNSRRLIYAAIDGMLNATGDPHTIFLSPHDNRAANAQLNGVGFSGIGAIVVPHGKYLQILATVPGEPAAKAGLQPGDVLMTIDRKSVVGMATTDAITRIHGQSGTIVRLGIRRAGLFDLTVPVKRATIPPITAYGRMLPGRLGYLDILSFGGNTGNEVRKALHVLNAGRMRGLVVDLRGNPGGYVDAAQQVVSDFVAHGVVAYEQQPSHKKVALNVISNEKLVKVPVVTLVDAGTASAAEITAAALREDLGVKLIGERTYGKGSMQSVYSLGDGSTVRITDRLWLTPHKHSIGKVGLQPDISVAGGVSGDPQLAAAEHYLLAHLPG